MIDYYMREDTDTLSPLISKAATLIDKGACVSEVYALCEKEGKDSYTAHLVYKAASLLTLDRIG